MTRYLSYTILFCQISHRWGRPLYPTGQYTPFSPTFWLVIIIFLYLTFYILTFILFDLCHFTFIVFDFLLLTFWHLTFIPFDFWRLTFIIFDFLHLTSYILTFIFFDLFPFDILSLLTFCIWLATFDFHLFLLSTFDFLPLWPFVVLTFRFRLFVVLTFIRFDFLPVDFHPFSLLVFYFSLLTFCLLTLSHLTFCPVTPPPPRCPHGNEVILRFGRLSTRNISAQESRSVWVQTQCVRKIKALFISHLGISEICNAMGIIYLPDDSPLQKVLFAKIQYDAMFIYCAWQRKQRNKCLN